MDVLFLKLIHNRSYTLFEIVTRMDLELRQLASLLDQGDLHGKQLDEVIAQVASIKQQRADIMDALRQYNVKAGGGQTGS